MRMKKRPPRIISAIETCSISVRFEIAEKAKREEHVLEGSSSLNVAAFARVRMYHVHSRSDAGSNGGHFPERDRVNVYSRGTDRPTDRPTDRRTDGRTDGRTDRWMDRGTDGRTDVRVMYDHARVTRLQIES